MKKNKKDLKIVGLTGGIATGKSTVAKILRRMKIPVIDADAIAHDVTRPNEAAYFKIVKAFGKNILQKNGAIDRHKLGQIVFANAKLRKKLEAIVHPAVRKKIAEQIKMFHKQNRKMVVLEVPLLFEVGWDKFCDEVWVVAATQKQQIERLQKRNGLTRAEALRRIKAQWPLDLKAKAADVVFKNTFSFQKLNRMIQKMAKPLVPVEIL